MSARARTRTFVCMYYEIIFFTARALFIAYCAPFKFFFTKNLLKNIKIKRDERYIPTNNNDNNIYTYIYLFYLRTTRCRHYHNNVLFFSLLLLLLLLKLVSQRRRERSVSATL